MKNEKTQISLAKALDTIVVKRRSLLRIVRGVGAGSEITLDDRPVHAGRSDDADLILDDPAASRKHFAVKAGQGGHVLHDMGSTNGTQVNHTPVLECRLTNGDIITVGETDVAFCEETDVEVPEEK
jgi:pSer/pThr/pTyr-binding forkhead associated (FHA) protein